MPPSLHTESAPSRASLSVGSFIKTGWELFKKHPWIFLFAPLLFGLIGAVANGVGSLVQVIDGSADYGLGHLLSFLVSLTVNVFVGIVGLGYFIKAHDAPETTTYYDAWRPDLFWKYLGAYFLYMLIVCVGLLLFIIPGVIAAIVYGLTLYLVVDKGMGPIEALKESARLTKGNRWRMFAYAGASGLLAILGLICLVVGYFVAAPVIAFSGVEMYRRISEAAETNTRTPLSGGEKALAAAGILLPILLVVVGIGVAIMLASVGIAQGKGNAESNEAQLKILAAEVEFYYSEKDAYPATLDDVNPPKALFPKFTDLDLYTYTTDAKHETYELCTTKPVPEDADNCVSSEAEEDATSTLTQ